MANVVSFGYTDTPIEGVPSLTFPRGLPNFVADWSIKSQNVKECVLTNVKASADQPEKLRISFSEVPNIYAGSGISESVYGPSKKGISLLVQLTAVKQITSDTDPSYIRQEPWSVYTVVKVPLSEYTTAQGILDFLGRHLSGFFNTGSLTTARLDAMLRGCVAPSEL